MEDDRKMYPATCSECGNSCEVPFEPSKDKPVKCKECYVKSRPPRRFDGGRSSSGSSGGRFGNNRRFGGDRQMSSGPREMHDAKCTKCGKACQVPFKPTEGKSVLCRECFSQSRE